MPAIAMLQVSVYIIKNQSNEEFHNACIALATDIPELAAILSSSAMPCAVLSIQPHCAHLLLRHAWVQI